jgi:hypothetical protein
MEQEEESTEEQSLANASSAVTALVGKRHESIHADLQVLLFSLLALLVQTYEY